MEEYFALPRESLASYPGAYGAIILGALTMIAVVANWVTKYILIRWLNRLVRSLPVGRSEDRELQLAVVSRLSNIATLPAW